MKQAVGTGEKCSCCLFFYKKKLIFFDVIFLEKHNSKLECLNFLIELKILLTTNTKKITKKKYDSFYDKKTLVIILCILLRKIKI